MENIVGLLINTIPVRVTVDPAESVLDLMTRIQEQQTGLIPYHHLPLAEIQRLAPHTNSSTPPPSTRTLRSTLPCGTRFPGWP